MQFWAFDCEWAPDIKAGRMLHRLPPDVPDEEVMRVMWRSAPDYDAVSNPQPFLKTILCRLVSIAAVVRDVKKGTDGRFLGDVSLHLWTVPALGEPLIGEPRVDDSATTEADILNVFLQAYGQRDPTLVGYNSRSADIHILLQRAFVNGLCLPPFFKEATDRPWNMKNIDIMEYLGGRGRGFGASLNEVAVLSGIPGKIDTRGDDVAGMFYGGHARGVVEYNMFDAITTYLVWLRLERLRGAFTPEQYLLEQRRTRALLEEERDKPNGAYLNRYLEEWKNLSPDLF